MANRLPLTIGFARVSQATEPHSRRHHPPANLSERLQGTYRSRIKTLRGMDTLESGQRYPDGWTLNYNLFRKHESLRNQTPGHRAKVNPPFSEWADVVKDGTTPQVFR